VVAVVDADAGKVIVTYPIGDHVEASAFDSTAKLVFHSTGDGNVAVFHQDSYPENVPTSAGSKTLALDAETHRLFVPAMRSGDISVRVLDRTLGAHDGRFEKTSSRDPRSLTAVSDDPRVSRSLLPGVALDGHAYIVLKLGWRKDRLAYHFDGSLTQIGMSDGFEHLAVSSLEVASAHLRHGIGARRFLR
jgi:hypothetical protein